MPHILGHEVSGSAGVLNPNQAFGSFNTALGSGGGIRGVGQQGGNSQFENFIGGLGYPQALVQQAQIGADASTFNNAINAGVQQQRTLAGLLGSQYGTDAQLQGILQSGPNQLAATLAGSVPPAQANIYGSNVNAIAGQNIAQLGNEARAHSLAQILGFAQPLLQGGQFQAPDINTNYGAGVTYAT